MLQRKSWGPVPLLVLRSPQAGCSMSDSLVVAFAAGSDFSLSPAVLTRISSLQCKLGQAFHRTPEYLKLEGVVETV